MTSPVQAAKDPQQKKQIENNPEIQVLKSQYNREKEKYEKAKKAQNQKAMQEHKNNMDQLQKKMQMVKEQKKTEMAEKVEEGSAKNQAARPARTDRYSAGEDDPARQEGNTYSVKEEGQKKKFVFQNGAPISHE